MCYAMDVTHHPVTGGIGVQTSNLNCYSVALGCSVHRASSNASTGRQIVRSTPPLRPTSLALSYDRTEIKPDRVLRYLVSTRAWQSTTKEQRPQLQLVLVVGACFTTHIFSQTTCQASLLYGMYPVKSCDIYTKGTTMARNGFRANPVSLTLLTQRSCRTARAQLLPGSSNVQQR